MHFFVQLFILLLLSFTQSNIVAQAPVQKAESPVKLEYVVAQEIGSAAMGSFVIKNNYPTRHLGDHVMLWELSFDGEVINRDVYPLGEIQPKETKYIGLRKLFYLHMLDELGDGLISLYAEIQDTRKDANPVRIVGESVVLAEAVKTTTVKREQYHVIKIAGARIHRIANGNSITIDPFNQIVGLDLGEGNLLAGPIRPILKFDSHSQFEDSTAFAKTCAQSLIDSLGPTRIEVDKNIFSGVIEYDLDRFGLLKLPFSFGESGLTIALELSGQKLNSTRLGFEIPMRETGDTIQYLGQQMIKSSKPIFGDTKLGKFELQLDSATVGDWNNTSMLDTRSVSTSRGDIVGTPFTFEIRPATGLGTDALGLTQHTMSSEMHVFYLERPIPATQKSFRKKVKLKPISTGEWLFTAPVSDR